MRGVDRGAGGASVRALDRAADRALDTVLRRRMATQRLTSTALPSAADAVRLLTCVQAQDPGLATWALGLRSRHREASGVLAEQATGAFVRTHLLRPTWHYVAAADLRWIVRTTSARVEAGMAARHRQLGLDDVALGRGIDALRVLLAGAPTTRRRLGALADPRLPPAGEALGHLLLVAELRGVVCSGPPRDTEHTYALVDEVVPATGEDDPGEEEGVRRLALRFFTGHGPAGDRDLARWSSLTLTTIRPVLADLEREGLLAATTLDGDRLWSAPGTPPRATRTERAYLLSVFDEAFLTYRRQRFPRPADERLRADRTRLFAQSGGGVVILDRRDVGTFRRSLTADVAEIAVTPEARLDAADRDAVAAAAQRYAAFAGRDLRLVFR